MRTALAASISLLCLAASATALAQDGPAKPTPINAAERAAVVATLGQQLKSNYVFPDLAEKLATATAAKQAKGGYNAATTSHAMSEALTNDLVEIGTDALVLDLRRNGGGEPESVAHLLSHFFAEGDERHLNDIYDRPKNSTREYWTNPAVTVRYTKPIYVLTSSETFSGGEEAAYDLQTQKRATLVGETTGGGANPGDNVALGHGLVAFIPTGRSINPITKTNWEHVGVKPDVAVPATTAMKAAYVAILTEFAAKAINPEERESFKETIAQVEKDEIDLPKFVPRSR